MYNLLLSLPFAFHILFGCLQTLGVNFGPWINYRYNGPFYDHFCTKTGNVVFQFAISEWRRYPKTTAAQIDLS